MNTEKKMEHAILGGGCFWCLEAVFTKLRGVESVISGYAGGTTIDPTYEAVSSGTTGHAEVAEIYFDPEVLSYRKLLEVFFTLHDPTTLNRQGADVGSQYRSLILITTAEQRLIAQEMVAWLEAEQVFAHPIVTEIKPLDVFYRAEAFHQDYYAQHPEQAYCQAVIAPKLAHVRASFQKLFK